MTAVLNINTVINIATSLPTFAFTLAVAWKRENKQTMIYFSSVELADFQHGILLSF